MKPSISFFILSCFFAGLISCNEAEPKSYLLSYHPRPSAIFDNNAGGLRNPKHGQPGHRCDIPDGALLPAGAEQFTSATTATSLSAVNGTSPSANSTQLPDPGVAALANTTALNPAHGQPGHRCDIAVGAPLNAAPAIKPENAQAAATNEGSKLNPAHGQPGHRCDIAVGAPLNSSKTNSPSSTNTTTNSVTQKPKLNPAHGQPWHRCDIAVGVPLDSPVTTKNSADSLSANALKPQLIDTNKAASVIKADSISNNTTGSRLNPPHGQPGYDCSVAVGKPLKQQQ